ncbi:fimbrial protein [Pseudomonas sp. B329]|uniref:fimbrial protein n=1 Tax=Pseudomonas sp. B329 TaxID=1553459 RepID=UPI002005D6DA|nr:fimbrial protein [Pseudomonas sp. B329]MCK3863861.1 hypothetical protein [Pseudomonas sp. B329]
MKNPYRILAILSVAALPLQCFGEDNLQFTGTLIAPPPCTISDKGGPINVHFEGNIAISKIDGAQYRRQAIPYQIACPGAPQTARMTLTLRGAVANFDPTALKTSIDGLGIRVLLDGSAMQPHRINTINASGTMPKLEAVPVKLIGATLPSTTFRASALLIAELY